MENFTQQVYHNEKEYLVEVNVSFDKGDYDTPPMADAEIVTVYEIMEDGTEKEVTKELDPGTLGTLEEQACEKQYI